MKRVIITGATGFVGANLVRRLLSQGHQVHALVRPGYQSWRLEGIRESVSGHEVSFADTQELDAIVGRIRPDWIFHLAANGAYSWQKDVAEMIETNVVGTANLVQACLKSGFEAFVNTGSSSEYGFKDHAPSETSWLDPNSYYAVTKAAATQFCRYTARDRGVLMPTLRLYSVYGAYEDPGRLIPTLVLRGMEGTLPPLVNPNVARDFVYIEDVLDAYLLAATTTSQEPGSVYNVGTGIQTTLQDIVEIARQTLQIKAEPDWGAMPNRHWDTGVWVADNRKITADLGWRPQYTVDQGFQETVRWFSQHSSLRQFYLSASVR